MGAVDAATARAMAQKIQRAMPGIQYLFLNLNPLLRIAKQKGNIEWGGSHTEFEWFMFKDDVSDADWGGGELSVNTFEEQDPAFRAHLPYCWLQKNYGVSDRTMESNRNSPDRVFKPLAANLKLAQIKMYSAFRRAFWDGASDGDGSAAGAPVGLKWAAGNPYESTTVVVATGSSYANRTLNTNALTSYSAGRAGFDDPQWAPECLAIGEVPNTSSAKWSTYCVMALAYMEEEMAITADISGTGEVQKPDVAFMARDPYHALLANVITSQTTYGIPAQLVNKDLRLAGWRNIMVGEITCIHDNNVPDGSGSKERVFVLDSNQYKIRTTHKKSEGLVKNDFDETSVFVNGVFGKLTANIGQYMRSPTAMGCIVGCDD